MSSILGWMLRRKAVVILITLLTLLAGVFATTQLKSELLPNINIPYLTIATAYTGAKSELVTEKVSVPIEGAVSQVPRLKQVRSTSQESFSLVVAEFEFGTNMKDVEQTLTTKLRAVNLPSGLNGTPVQPNISTVSANGAVLEITLAGQQGQTTDELTKWGREIAKPALLRVAEVGNIEVTGGSSQLLNISFKPAELAKHGITLEAVSQQLGNLSLTFPAGSATAGNLNLPTSVVYSFKTPDEMGNVMLLPSRPEVLPPAPTEVGTPAETAPNVQATPPPAPQMLPPVYLRDVADVKIAPNQGEGISRTNGKPSLSLQVYKSQQGNILNVSNGIKRKIDELNAQYPAFKLQVLYDTADEVRRSTDALIKEGLFGAVFCILVIFVFLRSVRSTLVTAISIPTSVVLAFILMWTQGITLNIFTLGGLAVAIGRVVDDAIVVLENIYRHVQEGEPVPTAVKKGTSEVALAITSSTVTTVAVFLPLGFTGGLVGQVFLPFALTVSFALLASLVVALTIVPVFAGLLITKKMALKERERHAQKVHADKETWLQRTYRPALKWSLRHRALTLLAAFGLMAGSVASLAVFSVPVAFLPESGEKWVNVSITVAPGTNQATILNTTEQVEKVAEEYRAKKTVSFYQTSILGNSEFARSQKASGEASDSSVLMRLDASANTREVVRELNNRLKPLVPAGGGIAAAPLDGFSGNNFSVIIQGANPQAVRDASGKIVEALRTVPNLSNVQSDVSQLISQVVITPDPTKNPAANTALVGSQIRLMLQGQNLGVIRFANGQELDTFLVMPKPDGGNIDQYLQNLRNLQLAEDVKLGDVAKVERVEATTQNTRVNQALAATVKANILSDDTAGVSSAAQAKVAALQLPAGVTTSLSGTGETQNEAFNGLFLAMAIAVGLVYLVLVITFGSLLEPFVILFSIPLASIGVIWSLIITQRALGLPAMIGMLMLIGIVVTNAIVLLDMVHQLRKQGYSKEQALLQAGSTRLRPILMTAFATILALIPLAMGFSQGSIIAAELGTVVIGGLLTSTFLTLLVVPVIYSLLEGLREKLSRSSNHDGDDDNASDNGTSEAEKSPDDTDLLVESVPVVR